MEENRIAVNKQLPSYVKIARLELRAEPFEKTPTQKIKRYLYRLAASSV
jgi:long-chain acyl-CoA synthetase